MTEEFALEDIPGSLSIYGFIRKNPRISKKEGDDNLDENQNAKNQKYWIITLKDKRYSAILKIIHYSI